MSLEYSTSSLETQKYRNHVSIESQSFKNHNLNKKSLSYLFNHKLKSQVTNYVMQHNMHLHIYRTG